MINLILRYGKILRRSKKILRSTLVTIDKILSPDYNNVPINIDRIKFHVTLQFHFHLTTFLKT